MLLPFMIKLVGLLKLYKLKLLILLILLKRFLYITIVFWNSCLVVSLHIHSDTCVITHVERLSYRLLILRYFELLNSCSKLEATFLPAALDMVISYFVDSLCVFLCMRVL
jgi:hypothetical protein